MRVHWNQFGQHAACSTKHKSKFKNQNLSYQQAQNDDLIDFQIHLQYDSRNLFQTSPKSSNDTYLFNIGHLAQQSHIKLVTILEFML